MRQYAIKVKIPDEQKVQDADRWGTSEKGYFWFERDKENGDVILTICPFSGDAWIEILIPKERKG